MSGAEEIPHVLRMRPSSARLRWLAAIAIFGAALSACDPCSGVASCRRGDYLAVEGQVVDPVSGVGIGGVRIDVVRVAGLSLDVDSLRTETSADGQWRLELSPRDRGAVQVDIVVSAPGVSPYRVPGVTLETRENGGDATVLEHWVPVPYFSYAGELYLNGTVDTRVEGAQVEFRRTGGVALRGDGVSAGVYRTTTDAGGRFALFPTDGNAVFPVTVGEVVGDLVVDLGPQYGTTVLREVRLAATPVYRRPAGILRYAVGPSTP